MLQLFSRLLSELSSDAVCKTLISPAGYSRHSAGKSRIGAVTRLHNFHFFPELVYIIPLLFPSVASVTQYFRIATNARNTF
jgi:hypothetical protein